MALPQLIYPLDMALSFEGAAADGSQDSFRISATNTAAASFFGRACLAVTTDGDQFVQPTGSAGVFLGILQHSHAIEQGQVTAGGAGLPVNHPGAVVRRGRVWVVAETVIADTTAGVFYRHASPGADPEFFGRLSDTDDVNTTAILNARWVRVTSAVGALTIVELNLP